VLPVEGGLSRILAIFSSRFPPVVGPVRSAREDDLEPEQRNVVHVQAAKRNDTSRRRAVAARACPAATTAPPQDPQKRP
jgi:hypothetical protein